MGKYWRKTSLFWYLADIMIVFCPLVVLLRFPGLLWNCGILDAVLCRVGRFKSAWFKSRLKSLDFYKKNHWLKSKEKKKDFFAKKTIINYRNHWQNVKIIISVHLGPPDPGLCSFNANVLRDLTLEILDDVFVIISS